MPDASTPHLSVSDFVALTNQTLEYAYPSVVVEGEVAEFKISQGKWVSFKLKDQEAVVNCFMGVFSLRVPLEDGMKIAVVAAPRLNQKGYFTLTVRTIKLIGEGSIKKGFELLKQKFEAEGLFSPERKRPLPRVPRRIALVTSTESAAYADFCKILNDRWGGVRVDVAHTQVQGDPAPDQMIRAIRHFNSAEQPADILVIIRGGGSAEDLATFNDEQLARTIAESRIPTLVGVGHEVDHTLADMVADRRAATPTNAAEIVVPDRREIVRAVRQQLRTIGSRTLQAIDQFIRELATTQQDMIRRTQQEIDRLLAQMQLTKSLLAQLNPEVVLQKGYALVRGAPVVGAAIEIETHSEIITAEVTHVKKRN